MTVQLAGPLTAAVGPNGAGKTALLQALAKMFGVTKAQRTVHRSDFHVPPAEPPASGKRPTRQLWIDVVVSLPELAKGTASAHSVAPTFRHMRIERAGAVPACRLRLEARWDDDGTAEGEVTQDMFWVDTLGGPITEDKRHRMSAAERGLIQLYYTPATRDAEAQIKASTGALAARLLRAIEWSSNTHTAVEDASDKLGKAFQAEEAIKEIASALSARWSALHDAVTDTQPNLSLVSRRFEDVVARIAVVFQQGPAADERTLDALSDGQQSLFYFALAAAVFDLERAAVAGKIKGFRADDLLIPALTIFATEEPENHLSPYYLSRIVGQIRTLLDGGAAQAIVTSHSPAVLSRVEPEEVRYCRFDATTRLSSVRSIELPSGDEEAIKFVRGAILAFPELYFARFVLLVEGDSERIVLPRLAEALGFSIDPSFVAIVPLGGRHVQHFWRLLGRLEIPYATLLDLDLGREGGAYGRIKTAIANLLDIGVERHALLTLKGGAVMPEKQFAAMHTWDVDYETLQSWVSSLHGQRVFFSEPLDLDLMMLAAFPDAYAATIPAGGGPRLTNEEAAKAVLSADSSGLNHYVGSLEQLRQHMAGYRYHFLTHSKPAAHLRALAHLDNARLVEDMPTILRQVLEHIRSNLKRG